MMNRFAKNYTSARKKDLASNTYLTDIDMPMYEADLYPCRALWVE
jgi:hypothetical protein